MNGKRLLSALITILALLLAATQAAGQQGGPVSPQAVYGSAFTYQGQLRNASGPVNACDCSSTCGTPSAAARRWVRCSRRRG